MYKILLVLLIFSSIQARECPIRDGFLWSYMTIKDETTIEFRIAVRKLPNIFYGIVKKCPSCTGCFTSEKPLLLINDRFRLHFNNEFITYKVIRTEYEEDWVNEPLCKGFCFEELYDKFNDYCG